MSSADVPSHVTLLCPALGLVPPDAPPQALDEAVAHFSSVPWCAALLNKPSPAVTFIPPSFFPSSPRCDQFIGNTIATPRGLRRVLFLFRPDDAAHAADPARPIDRIAALFALGDGGLCSWEGILHGGAIATLMDETLGTVMGLNGVLAKDGRQFKSDSVTGQLSLRFLRPVPASGELCVTAWIKSASGRKAVVGGELTGPTGEPLAVAESTWIAIKRKL